MQITGVTQDAAEHGLEQVSFDPDAVAATTVADDNAPTMVTLSVKNTDMCITGLFG